MNINEGATHEIVSRWPEFRQRNVALEPDIYGRAYRKAMLAGIQLVRHHHQALEAAGATTWTIPPELSALLDDLASRPSVTSSPPPLS